MKTHGMTGTRTYQAWQNMLRRCRTTEDWGKHYAGKGIVVCERWKSSFTNFHADMGTAPTGLTLDRVDFNGNYELGNCRWADRFTQAQNKSDNFNVTLNGETHCVVEWARRLGMKSMTIRRRLWNGWPTEDALSARLFHHRKGTRGRHTGKTRFIEMDGVKKSLAEWSRSSVNSYSCIQLRLNRGWDLRRALLESSQARHAAA